MIYYNEFDPFASSWLKELMKAGLIPSGDIDTRSIVEVSPNDLRGYTQCHFFAGLGGWAEALRLAGWGADRNVWTGSCPCQPFSTAGNQKGKSDERHLWPVWFNLIRECEPPVVFGEQVASAITHGWWDDVASDLESEGYACGAAIIPACSVGKAHKRDRLWFVGDAEYDGHPAVQEPRGEGQTIQHHAKGADCTSKLTGAGSASNVADTESGGRGVFQPKDKGKAGGEIDPLTNYCASGAWQTHTFEWIQCPDGKQRPVEPSICLLVDGVQNRVGKLRGLGNAIVPSVAAEFIKAFKETYDHI